MRTPFENIRIIGETTKLSELNAAYNETMIMAAHLSFDGVSSRHEVEQTLNHLTNYNIVRIANKAATDFALSGNTDRSKLVEIGLCRHALKEHEDVNIEQELLDNLCEQLGIN